MSNLTDMGRIGDEVRADLVGCGKRIRNVFWYRDIDGRKVDGTFTCGHTGDTGPWFCECCARKKGIIW